MRVDRGVASVQEHKVPVEKKMRSPAPSQRLQVTGGILKFRNLSRRSNEVGG